MLFEKEKRNFYRRVSFAFFHRLFFVCVSCNQPFRMLFFLYPFELRQKEERWASSQLVHKLSRFLFKNIPIKIETDIHSYSSMIYILLNNKIRFFFFLLYRTNKYSFSYVEMIENRIKI